MLLGALQRILSSFLPGGPAPNPVRARQFFLFVQLGFAAAILVLIYLASRRGRESSFRVRESDRKPSGSKRPLPGARDPLAEARMRRGETLSLPGIRIDGEPHEILGIARNASASEIHGAYRELMKRYHPDAVGRQGSREWTDAQKIAEALNRARAEMLAHSQSPNRSGR